MQQLAGEAYNNFVSSIGDAFASFGRALSGAVEKANNATVAAINATPGVVKAVGDAVANAVEPHDAFDPNEDMDPLSAGSFTTITRSAPGADGATSQHLIERDASGQVISRTHRVTDPSTGDIIHQHQEHIGKYGGERSFPEEWRQFPTIPPE